MDPIKLSNETDRIIEESIRKNYAWISKEKWQGYDPYDGLNSKLFQMFPFKSRLLRLCWIQFFKRSIINFRKVAFVPKGYNHKGLALIVDGLLNFYRVDPQSDVENDVIELLEILEKGHIKGYSGCCWGYNFDWQSRADFKPQGTPTIVTTSFIANTFLNAYEVLGDESYLKIARSSCEFILKDLNRTEESQTLCFSYSPVDCGIVHNANILGAHLLSRVSIMTGEKKLIEISNRAIDFVMKNQNQNGSWFYGNAHFHKWIDNFHTGFMLEFLFDYILYSQRIELKQKLLLGLNYYIQNLFVDNKIPKYFADKTYPIDIHSSAQAVITFVKLKDLHEKCQHLAKEIALWTIDNMQSIDGYFYFQKGRFLTNRIPYMRWSQAWMFRALTYLLNSNDTGNTELDVWR